MIKYVIFDYNGTLIEDLPIALRACNHMLSWYGQKEIDVDRFRETFVVPWQRFYIANGVKEEEINIDVHQKEYQKIDRLLRSKKLPDLREGATETLSYLKEKGYRLGLLSSRNEEDLLDELARYGIDNFFETIVGTESIKHDGTVAWKKNDVISQRMNINDPHKVLYIGDLVADIKNAHDSDWKIASIAGAWQADELLRAGNPDFFLEKITDLKGIL